jgi:type IV secretory pathway VirB4 component
MKITIYSMKNGLLFKATGDSPDDAKWAARWTEFTAELDAQTDTKAQKALISKFLTAQRAKKYRRNS